MRYLWILAVAAMASFSLNAADLGGTWKGTMRTQMGPMDITITLKAGDTVAGSVRAGEYEGTIEHGKLDGDTISFEMNIEPGRLIYEGTVKGDEMKLNVTGTQGNEYSLICKRQKAE